MRILMIFLCIIFVLNLSATIINIPAEQPTIQAGIYASANGDTVLVQPGTYLENINYNGKLVTVASLFLTTQDTTYISQTIIDGNQNGSVVKFISGEDSTAVLTGFTITNGMSLYGGGIYCSSNSCPIWEYLIITGNSTLSDGWDGGGILCYDSSPILRNVTISGNTAFALGGGFYCSGSNPSFENVTISGNSAGFYGGGICCRFNSSTSLENVTITGNSSHGIFCGDNSNTSLENVTIAGNSSGICCIWNSVMSLANVTIAGNSGNGIHCEANSSTSLVNVTITSNSSNYSGGGIFCYDGGVADLINCILFNNSPQEVEFLDHFQANEITIAYSDIEGGLNAIVTNNNGIVNWLEGNIDEEPLFVSIGDYPFSLQDLSPCVNAGSPDTTGLNLPEYDLAGNQRIFGGRIDMGAYENQNVIVNSENYLIHFELKF